MWHWQPSESRDLKRTVIIISCVLHVVILGWLLFLYKGEDAYHLVVGKNVPNFREATIVVMPFQKGIHYQAGTGSGKGSRRVVGAKKNSRGSVKTTTVKLAKKEKTTLVTSVKRGNKKHTMRTSSADLAKKKKDKKLKKNQKAKVKKLHKTKNKKIKKKIEKKPEVESIPPEKQEPEKPIEQPMQALPQEKIEAEKTDVAPAQTSEQVLTGTTDVPGDGQGPIVFVGQQELVVLQMQQEVQSEVERCWKPPVGLRKDLVCEISCVVDGQGAVQEAKVYKASGVLVYDINARSTVLAMNFPQCVWGKELILHFKQ